MFPKITTLKNGKELTIREARAADSPQMIDYVNRVAGETDFLTFGGGEFWMTVEEESKFVEDHYSSENQIFLLAMVDEEIIGILNVDGTPKKRLKHCVDFGISVLRSHWGLGVGSTLMNSMIEWAKSTGVIRKINLHVLAENKRAISFYKKIGFEEEGFIKRDTFVNGEFKDSYVMGLLID